MSLQYIETPNNHDILSGRGNFVNYHPGNEHFRALVRKHKVAYVACPKSMKGKFAEMIVEEIKQLNPPGRFLKQDEETKLWYDIGEKKALDKTRQALREGAPEIQKAISPEDESPINTISDTTLVQGRRASTGTIVPLSTCQNDLQERRISAPCIDPSLLREIADEENNADVHHLGGHGNSIHLLQVPISYQHQSMPTTDDNYDPYCSTLPPEHFEGFSNGQSFNPLQNDNNMSSYNPMMTQAMNNNYNYFQYRNPISALTTIAESKGNGNAGMDTGYYNFNNNQQYHFQNPQNIGQQGNYVDQLSNLSQRDESERNQHPVVQSYQPNLGAQTNYTRQNQQVNSNNRTYKVRPEPIQVGRSKPNDNYLSNTGMPTGNQLYSIRDTPVHISSLSDKDMNIAKQKNRCITPRRMIINVQQPSGAQHQKSNSSTVEYGTVRFSPPSRSRLRGRRDDSNRSVLSTASIRFDKIFREDDTIASQQKTTTSSDESFLSFMSLSIADDLEDMEPNNMPPFAESSVKVSAVSVERIPLKRHGSEFSHVDKAVYDMSVNTIGFDDDMNSMAANNNMSFLHAFEDN